MRIYPKGVTPECFNRGPVPVSPGFPIEAFGMTDFKRSGISSLRSKLRGINSPVIELNRRTVIHYCGSLITGAFAAPLPVCGSPINRKELKTSVSLWFSCVAAGS